MAKIDELIKYLTEGLDSDQAKIVTDALKNEKVAARAESLKQKTEYEAIERKTQELQGRLDGADGKPGAAAYEKWYQDNFAAIQKLDADRKAYEAKFGALDNPNTDPKADPNPKNPATGQSMFTKEDVARMVDERIQGGYAPRWSDLMTDTGTIIQKHMFAGRKAPIDMKKLGEIAAKHGGDLNRAYDEYDEPEREKERSAKTESEILRRVNEEVQKRGASTYFPAGADSTPSPLSRKTGTFDKEAQTADLLRVYNSGTDDKLSGFGAN